MAPHGAAKSSTNIGSISRRLTLLYVASTAALLLVATGFLYWTLKRDIEMARHGLLASKTEVLRLLLRDQPIKADVLASEVEHEAGASHLLKYYVRILDEHCKVLLETPGMKGLLPQSLFPAPVETSTINRPSLPQQRLAEKRWFVLHSIAAPVGRDGRTFQTVQIAHDITASVTMLADYRLKLLGIVGLGLIFAALAGAWVAHSGMQPLAEITKVAQQVTATHLDERVARSHWPTELTELAAAFDAMLDRLESSFKRLSEFSGDLAHALRSPINNLRGEAEVSLSRSRTPEEYQHILESSLEEYERLSRMIDGLLFLARADDPSAAVEQLRFDARKEIEAVREFYEALAIEQKVHVVSAGQVWLVGDSMLFRRAVSNLLANSLRHTPAGGCICIRLSQVEQDIVQVTVTDTGKGIAPEHLPKVFDRFFRAGKSDSLIPGGSGLGLAIVQSIMRLHGGTAMIQSAPGRGTRVTLKFPSTVVLPSEIQTGKSRGVTVSNGRATSSQVTTD